MARSVRWPFQVTARGGLALTSDTDQGVEEMRQTAILAHLPGPSGSAYGLRDDVGAPEVAFGVRDGESGVAPAVVHSRRFFARMESQGRAKLRPGFPRFRAIAGRPVVEVEFDDLESGQPQQIEAGGGSGQ